MDIDGHAPCSDGPQPSPQDPGEHQARGTPPRSRLLAQASSRAASIGDSEKFPSASCLCLSFTHTQKVSKLFPTPSTRLSTSSQSMYSTVAPTLCGPAVRVLVGGSFARSLCRRYRLGGERTLGVARHGIQNLSTSSGRLFCPNFSHLGRFRRVLQLRSFGLVKLRRLAPFHFSL